MNKFQQHLLAACAAALALAASGCAAAEAALTRAEVRQALHDARASDTMTPAGEIGDTAAVLAARDRLPDFLGEPA